MGISDFDTYYIKIIKIFECLDVFCEDLEIRHKISLQNGKEDPELEEIVNEIKKIKIKGEDDHEVTKKKAIGYLYNQSIKFLPTDKISNIAVVSEKFLINLDYIYTDRHVVHHGHMTGKIFGHAHEYCNIQARENYYVIPVISHNQFRFDFF